MMCPLMHVLILLISLKVQPSANKRKDDAESGATQHIIKGGVVLM